MLGSPTCSVVMRSRMGLPPGGQFARATYPQIGQAAIPLLGSTSRKLAHPLVRQNVRPAAVDWVERRRSRRMELDRPAKVEVAERVIMVFGTRELSSRQTT